MPNFVAVHAAVKKAHAKRSQNVGPNREEHVLRWDAQREKQIRDIFAKYDKDSNQMLDRKELKRMMEDLNKGKSVGEEDVDHIIDVCNASKGGTINRQEVLFAVSLWEKHLALMPTLAEWMEEYDTDQSGDLDKWQMKNFLEGLNEGKPVHDYEVEWVMRRADELGKGKIGTWELERATTLWYFYIERRKTKSACCVMQ
eukprot:TRINITY_DN24685_c0_g3_i1.p1 TRINITY_DN24685_c0_g3~~TRINITY_DN24685_c0_g3_i1.p1  ORF type:complete len:199 (+),score=58.81 TRINITY_DN24685_c0_g3_i1:56-652(+)